MKTSEIQKSLDKLEEKVDSLLESHHELKTELAVHKVKSGFWGALMGAIAAIVSVLVGKNA